MPPPEPYEAGLPGDVPLHVWGHLGHVAPGMEHLAVDRTPPAFARGWWRSTPQLDVDPTFKGVWSRAVNFAPLSPPDTTLGQYRQHHRQLDDSPGHHGPEGSAYCPQRSARASPA